jgi:hypothetical protein
VKQFCADDSAATSVKVGYCQAFILESSSRDAGAFFFSILFVLVLQRVF